MVDRIFKYAVAYQDVNGKKTTAGQDQRISLGVDYDDTLSKFEFVNLQASVIAGYTIDSGRFFWRYGLFITPDASNERQDAYEYLVYAVRGGKETLIHQIPVNNASSLHDITIESDNSNPEETITFYAIIRYQNNDVSKEAAAPRVSLTFSSIYHGISMSLGSPTLYEFNDETKSGKIRVPFSFNNIGDLGSNGYDRFVLQYSVNDGLSYVGHVENFAAVSAREAGKYIFELPFEESYGRNYKFKAYALLIDDHQVNASEVQDFEVQAYGDQDYAQVTGTATILRHVDEGIFDSTDLTMVVSANANNTRTDIKSYTVKYSSDNINFNEIGSFPVSNYKASTEVSVNIRDDVGPNHYFKVYISFFDGTETEAAPTYMWVDPYYGVDDVMEITGLVYGARNNNSTPITLVYQRSQKSEKPTPISYKLYVKSGRREESATLKEISMTDPSTFTYNAPDNEGPYFSFKVLALWDDLSQSSESKTTSKEWIYTNYGNDDKIDADPVTGVMVGTGVISLNIDFSLNENNDKDDYVTGYRLYKWNKNTKRYESFQEHQNKEASRFTVQHVISTDKNESLYKITILWANDVDGHYESDISDSPSIEYTYEDYGLNDSVDITGIQLVDTTPTEKKLNVDFVPKADNDRKDYKHFQLFYSVDSPNRTPVLAAQVNNPSRSISVNIPDDYENLYFRVIPVWEEIEGLPNSGSLEKSTAYYWNDNQYGADDKLIINYVTRENDVVLDGNHKGINYMVNVTIPSSNDRVDHSKIIIYLLVDGVVPPTGVIKGELNTVPGESIYSISVLVPRNKGPVFDFSGVLYFDNGAATPISNTDKYSVTLDDYGSTDSVVIDSVSKGERGDEGSGPFTKFNITYHEVEFNDRYGQAKKYILERLLDEVSNVWVKELELPASSVADYFEPFEYKALDSEAPVWRFRVRADYSGDGVNLNPEEYSQVYTYTLYDPANTDTVIMLTTSSKGRNVSDNAEYIDIPFQVPISNKRKDIKEFVLYAKIESISNQFIEVERIPNGSNHNFEYLCIDDEGPLWKFKVSIVFTDNSETDISLVEPNGFPNYDPKDESFIYITNISTVNIENRGSYRYDRLTIEFKLDHLLYPIEDVEDFSIVFSSYDKVETSFRTFGIAGYSPNDETGTQYFSKDIPREHRQLYFHIYANLKNGEKTLFDEGNVYTYLTPDFGKDDEIVLSTPIFQSNNFEAPVPYTKLLFGYTFSDLNDRDENEVSRYDLMLEVNGEYESVAIATTSGRFYYNAPRKNGPTFNFKGLIRYNDGYEAYSKSVITYRIDDYGDFDRVNITDVFSDSDVFVDGNQDPYYKVNVLFEVPHSNDRVDIQKYMLYVSHNGEDGDYFNQAALEKVSTDTTAFRYSAYAKDGANVWFKVRLLFSDGTYSDLDQSDSYFWRNPDYGHRDTVSIDDVKAGQMISLGDTLGFATPITVKFSPSIYNTRYEDFVGYELQVSNPLIDNGKWKNNGFSGAAGQLTFNALVKYAPTWHIRVLIKYDDGTYSPEDLAEVYTFAQLDPTNDDRAVIKSIDFKSRVINSDVPVESGSNVIISFEPDPGNNRTNIKNYDVYYDVLQSGEYSNHVATLGKDETTAQLFLKDSWGAFLYFKVKINFEDGSETSLGAAQAFMFDNSDPDNDDKADVFITYSGRKTTTAGVSGDEVLVNFQENTNNTRKNPVAFHLYVSRTGTEWSDRPEQTVYSGASAFLYFAKDTDGPMWYFKVIIEYAFNSLTSFDKTSAVKYERLDPNDEDNVQLFAPTTGATTTEGYQVQIAFRELPSNRRLNPVQYQLFVSKHPDGPFEPGSVINEKVPFIFHAKVHEGPVWYFKIKAFYSDSTTTNIDKCVTVSYTYPSYGISDHAEILEIIDQAKTTSNGVEAIPLKIVFKYDLSNHRQNTHVFSLYAKSSRDTEFKPVVGQIKSDTSSSFDYQAVTSEGPKWEFWIKTGYSDGSESVFNHDHVVSWENDSLDKAIIKSITLAKRGELNGNSGSELLIYFEADSNNVRG